MENLGYSNVRFSIPIIGLSAYGTSIYKIRLNAPFNLKEENVDSIRSVRKRMAIELYAHVVADSIIYDCRAFDIHFYFDETHMNPYYIDGIWDDILIDSLEEWTNTQVIRDQHGRYKRVPKRSR